VVWFQDRPERHAGHFPARELSRQWAAFGFQSDAPNAALTLLDGDPAADTVVVELLGRPRYDRARDTMTYAVRVLSRAPGRLADFQPALDAGIPRRFGPASLFIDTATARQISARRLGDGRWEVELE
jgi:hypothetical protein